MKIQELFSLLNKSRMAEIIIAICNGEKYFSFITDYVNNNFGKIIAATVNRRLNDLVELELVEKRPLENRPTDHSYHPTSELTRIHESLIALISTYEERPTRHQREFSVTLLNRLSNLQDVMLTESVEETVEMLVDQAEKNTKIYEQSSKKINQ